MKREQKKDEETEKALKRREKKENIGINEENKRKKKN